MFIKEQLQSTGRGNRIRRIFQASMLVILVLSLGACNSTLSAGASAQATLGVTETLSDPQDIATTSTQTSDDIEDSNSSDRVTYSNETYGFEFTYPVTWSLEEDEGAVFLVQNDLILRINFAWEEDDIGPGLFGRTGISAGDFLYAGKVRFLGQVIPVEVLEFEGKHKAVFYNGTNLIKVENKVFMIVLESSEIDYAVLDIPEEKRVETNIILESFKPVGSEEKCLEQGGRWEILGFSGPGCNLPTTDGGESCSDITECESLCLAADDAIMMDNGFGERVPDHERIDELNANGDELVGVCSEWQSDFGCQVVVEKGKYVVICID